MKAAIIYDSFFGNTQKVAEAMAARLDARIILVSNFKSADLKDVELLIIGSPTRAFRPSPNISNFLENLREESLRGIKVVAFDTRIDPRDIKSAFTRMMLGAMTKMFGYAAKPMANKLVAKGGQLLADPDGFYVIDSKGPLKEGELERAAAMAEKLAAD